MKSLNQNTRPKTQPKDTYRYGKNGISNAVLGAVENEKGFLLMQTRTPYRYIGSIATSKWPVLFSTDNTYSAIGYFDHVKDLYVPIIDDADEDFKLGFHSDFYITGESQRNALGEVIIAFTDKNDILGYLNCDNPSIESLQDLSLFPIADAPAIAIGQDTGGILIPGAYFAMVRYKKKDGTITGFIGNSGITIISGTSADGITDKTIVLTLTNIDQDYDYVEVAIVSKTGGVYNTPQLINKRPITGLEMQIVYSGTEVTTDITLENVLVPPPFYNRAETITQLNDALYLGGLRSAPVINMQRYANMIDVKWKSELMSVLSPDPAHARGEKRTFMHEEVASLYIQYSLTRGGWSQWFHIPGRSPEAADLLASSLGASQGITALKYQMEDTISTFDFANKEGAMGIWQNLNEQYPNHPDFDSSAIGGRDLRGENILHHRFPSLTWCKTNLYATEVLYGKSSLDLLGLKLSNVTIPSEYAEEITGWRVGFGKRTLGNATVIAQGALLHAARYAAYNGGNFTINSSDDNYISTGGNFHSGKKPTGNPPDNALGLDTRLVRFHGFDLLYNRPSVTADYISTHFKLKRTGLQTSAGFMEDNNLGFGDLRGPIVYLIDYLALGLTPTLAGSAKRYRKFTNPDGVPPYIPNNLVAGKWNNVDLETAYGGKINAPVLDTADISNQLVEWDEDEQGAGYCPAHEVTYLTNLMRVRDDIYTPFTAQTVVQSSDKMIGVTGTFFGGDSFICDYTFHTYGWWMQLNQRYNDISGTKVVRRILCETASNLYGRFETAGNIYSKWYPVSSMVQEDLNNYITQFKTAIDPNQFGYNKDLNALNELLVGFGIANTTEDLVTEHPFRIHRGGKLGRQDEERSWRTFLPLDYYEIKKSVGFIVNLEGQDDTLLIHCQHALLITQDKTKLETDVLQVTLGSADIFQFEPQDGQSAPLGYAGTQHDLGSIRTPMGYFSVDSESGEIFLYKGKLEQLGKGLYNTFLEIIRTFPTNVLQGDGITVGYDPQYKRFLFTVKRTKTVQSVRYDITDADIPTLEVGEYIFMHGRILEFLGVNTPETTGVTCDEVHLPIMASRDLWLDTGTYVNQLLDILTGPFVEEVLMLAVVPVSPGLFSLNPANKQLLITGTVDGSVQPVYSLSMVATSDTGHETYFTVTVNINLP
jgi:hypothetical protein